MIVTILTIAIVAGNLAVLVWFFSSEPNRVRRAVGALVLAALCLRLVYPTDYPPGYNPDEPKHCRDAAQARVVDNPILPSSDTLCGLSAVLFCVPLLPYLGPRLAIRGYSMVLGSLSVAAMYALCRAIELEQVASVTAAALITILPWSLFYGRVASGGDLTYYCLILGAALARLIWRRRAGLGEVVVGTGALVLLLYDYWSAMVLLVWPLVMVAFVPTWRRRLCCVAITVVAGAAWVPWWRVSSNQWVLWHMLTGTGDANAPPTWSLTPGVLANPFVVLLQRVVQFGDCLVRPVAQLFIWTQPALLIHPSVVLVAAAVGMIGVAWRQKLFVLIGCGLGILPALLASQPSINAHRALLGVPFVTVGAACGVHVIRWRRVQVCIAIALVAIAAVQSWSLFVSREFWPPILTDAFPFPS